MNTDLLNDWIAKHGPNGLAKLTVKSEVSSATIAKMRGGYVPPKESTRLRLCRAMRVEEGALFPLVTASEGEAS